MKLVCLLNTCHHGPYFPKTKRRYILIQTMLFVKIIVMMYGPIPMPIPIPITKLQSQTSHSSEVNQPINNDEPKVDKDGQKS